MARILVADDETDLQELLGTILSFDGHEIVVAGNGEAAMERLRAGPIDLLILDVMMPRRDGWWVLEQVKSSDEWQDLPVVMVTARAADLDRIQGKIGGAVRYVTKPFSVADLRRTVADVLAGPSEPEQRLRSQREGLVELARLERGAPAGPPPLDGSTPPARPRVTRLDGPGRPEPRPPKDKVTLSVPRHLLSLRQQALLDEVAGAPSVQAAAGSLAVSRSYLYAALGRIADKLGVASGPELIRKLRSGELTVR